MLVWLHCAHVEFVGCRFAGKLGVQYVLDAKKLSSSELDRAVFPRRDSSGRTVEEPTLTGTLMMLEQNRTEDVCQTHLVYISVSLRNSFSYLSPLFLLLLSALMMSVDGMNFEGHPATKGLLQPSLIPKDFHGGLALVRGIYRYSSQTPAC